LINPADTEGWEDPETGERRGSAESNLNDGPNLQAAVGSMDKVTVLAVRKMPTAIRFADQDGLDECVEEEDDTEEGLKDMLAALIRETRSINERLKRLEDRVG
jgi:hypothetical protein